MEYQVEMLRKKLGEKVKGVFYGTSIEVRDPATGHIEKKPLKPFLVNQTTLLLERGQLRIPNIEIDETIVRQMTNFQVVRVSQTTQQPVYSDTDEHGLDAMIFALYAFMNEYPELINIVEAVEVARKSYITKLKQPNAVNDYIKSQLDKPKDELSSLRDKPRRSSPNFARRGSSTSSLGWGRRGRSSSGGRRF